jgi:predicted hydrocarbon binding protein
MRPRKDVIVYLYYPSAKLFHVVVELKNVPGALREVLTVFRDLNLNVVGSFSSVDSTERTGLWSGFVEGSTHTADELRKSISSIPFVTGSAIAESKNGFLVDGIHFPLTWNTGDRAVMMRSKHLVRMFERMRKEFGSGGNTIAFEEGFAYGTDTWTDLASRLGNDFARMNLKEVLMLYQAVGWFRLEAVDTSKDGTVTVRVSGNFECEGTRTAEPRSHFVRGHLNAALAAIMDRKFSCEEAKCAAKGDRNCEFVLKPTSSA